MTAIIPDIGNIVTVDMTDLASCLDLAQQAAGGVIILVKRLCHLPWSHAFGKLFAEQVQDVLAFFRASDLLGISYLRPQSGLRIEPERQLLLLLDIAASHKKGGLMLTSLAFEDQ